MKPLEGIRVLDFTHVLAGPVCARLLVDLGAEVLKVESARRPDRPWTAGPVEGLDRSQAFVMVHRGKKSITLDLKTPQGRETAVRLAGVADVIIENFSPGVMHRLGLGPDETRERNPGLVYVSMSGYGSEGPRAKWTSMNSTLQAHSGSMMANDRDGNPPVSISNSWLDYMGGYHGCFSVLEGLRRRTVDGQGRYVDLSQFECGVAMLGPNLVAGIANGAAPARMGNRSPDAFPQGCYRCAGTDQWCAISVENDDQWLRLCDAVGWLHEPRFATSLGRLRHVEQIDAKLSSWTNTLPALDVERKLREANVPAQAMRTAKEIVTDADEVSVLLTQIVLDQSVLVSRQPFSFIPREDAPLGSPARMGEHTEEGLRDWLAMTAPEIRKLQEVGALQ
jgi:crotonobetainyl-CoA:carnitine CoA-transferase CaiB-like acyl-CoA transferase